MYKLKSTGSDLIGIKLGIGDEGLLINEEYIQTAETREFVVGSIPTIPSLTPSISASPTSVSIDDISCDICSNSQVLLSIKLMADNRSKEENMISIESYSNSKWEEKHRLHNFESDALNTFQLCFDDNHCHRLIITDSAFNGICCDYGDGWVDVKWNGTYCCFCANNFPSQIVYLSRPCIRAQPV